jgi:hypothetical protein
MKSVTGRDASFTHASAVLNNTAIAAARTKPDVAAVSFGESI